MGKRNNTPTNTPATNEESEFSWLDQQRSDETVKQLYKGAKELGFTGDVEHWGKLLKSRGIEPDG